MARNKGVGSRNGDEGSELVTPPRFAAGDRVQLRARPGRAGLVYGQPVAYASSYAYQVFFGADDIQNINETDLEPVGVARLQVMPRDEFLRGLLLAKVGNPLTDLLVCLRGIEDAGGGLPVQAGAQVPRFSFVRDPDR